jgi:hypothetical protein
VNEYANAVLAGELYPAPAAGARAAGRGAPKEDVSVVIAKLDAGLEDVSKQLKGVVRTPFSPSPPTLSAACGRDRSHRIMKSCSCRRPA